MRTRDFDYRLPRELIAQKPTTPRDHSRLLVLDKKTGTLSHRRFFELSEFLERGDVLVFNNSKVFKARLIGTKATGGKIEVFLLRKHSPNTWEVLIGGRGGNSGLAVQFGKGLTGTIIERSESVRLMQFNVGGKRFENIVDAIGSVPTPPYIKTRTPLGRYQTVYAKKRGSVAAPTAGLHFTPRLLKKLRTKGIQLEYITLHVGLGTFAPIKTERIEEHRIHSEFASINAATAGRLNRAKKQGRRIIAVGTTTVRTLEAFGGRHGTRDINLYITPGYKFKMIDAMITNFHLPRSSLLVLVSAFAGRKHILSAYQKAVRNHYRFYSLGDAMFIQ